jgi:hypothetical protein
MKRFGLVLAACLFTGLLCTTAGAHGPRGFYFYGPRPGVYMNFGVPAYAPYYYPPPMPMAMPYAPPPAYYYPPPPPPSVNLWLGS